MKAYLVSRLVPYEAAYPVAILGSKKHAIAFADRIAKETGDNAEVRAFTINALPILDEDFCDSGKQVYSYSHEYGRTNY